MHKYSNERIIVNFVNGIYLFTISKISKYCYVIDVLLNIILYLTKIEFESVKIARYSTNTSTSRKMITIPVAFSFYSSTILYKNKKKFRIFLF